MRNDEDSTNRINHVLGPEGQTVVIVPPEIIKVQPKEEEDFTTCIAWLVILACFAVILYIFGICFALIDSSMGYNIFVDVHRGSIMATHIFMGIGGFLTIVCILGWIYIEKRRKDSIKRLMYKYDPETQRLMRSR